MGACTSSVKHRQKHHRQSHKQTILENSTVLDSQQLPSTVLPNPYLEQTLLTNSELQSSSFIEPIVYQTENSSLIQLYTSNTNNNNNNNNGMSSSSSSSSPSKVRLPPPRIPVTRSRLPVVHHPSSSTTTGSTKPKNIPTTIGTTNPPDSTRSMSSTNRTSLPPSSPNRFGFIPRPTVPNLQPTQTQTSASLIARSRSISPASTNSANSSTSSLTQRVTKTQSVAKPVTNRSSTSKPKLPVAPTHDNTPSKTTVSNRVRSNTGPQTPLKTILPTKTDVNAIRDRYKTQTRMNFFTRRTPLTSSLKSPSMEPSVIKEEKSEQSLNDEQTTNNQNDDSKTEVSQPTSSSHGDSAYASIATSSNRPPSTQTSQIKKQRQRAPSTLSSSSALSDALNQDLVLDDDNCSLKSDDLICDYDETLTFDSVSKTEQTDSCSSNSLSMEGNKKPTMITSVPTKKPNITPFQPVLKDHRPTTITKSASIDKTNNSLQESLDELTRLSTRMDSTGDNEHHNRKVILRSVSLKPPPSSLPPREDGEQITMDIESYRQVMKDVMVVKTILHQLDRLLKHSDGANMTDSMIGSFHESMISSRHFSTSGDNNVRNSIDENTSYDDLLKEVMILRKEREQDKQTIKLLQEQMYKYSSQPNET